MVEIKSGSSNAVYPKRALEAVPFCNQLETIERITLNASSNLANTGQNYNNSHSKNFKQNPYAVAIATAASIQQQNLAYQQQAQKQNHHNHNQKSSFADVSVQHGKKDGTSFNAQHYQQNPQKFNMLSNFQKSKNSPSIQSPPEAPYALNRSFNNFGTVSNTPLFSENTLSTNQPIDLKKDLLMLNNGVKSTESPLLSDANLNSYQINNKVFENPNAMNTNTTNSSPQKLLISTSNVGVVPQSSTSTSTPTASTTKNFLDSPSLMPQVGSNFSAGNWNTTNSSIWGSPSSLAFSAGSSINTQNSISNNFGRTSNMW